MVTYDRVEVVVFVKDENDIGKYFRLFRVMLGDQVSKDILQRDHGVLETDKFRLRFYIGGLHMRGVKAHYVINMVQDIEFHHTYTLPMTIIQNYLKDDPKWSMLFNDKLEPYKAFLRKDGDSGWEFRSNNNDKTITTYCDLKGALFMIKEQGWTPVFSDEKLGIYTFTKATSVNQ